MPVATTFADTVFSFMWPEYFYPGSSMIDMCSWMVSFELVFPIYFWISVWSFLQSKYGSVIVLLSAVSAFDSCSKRRCLWRLLIFDRSVTSPALVIKYSASGSTDSVTNILFQPWWNLFPLSIPSKYLNIDSNLGGYEKNVNFENFDEIQFWRYLW